MTYRNRDKEKTVFKTVSFCGQARDTYNENNDAIKEPEKKSVAADESREKKDVRKRRSSSSSSSGSESRKQKQKKKKHRGEKKRSRGSESDEVPAEDLFGEKKHTTDMFAEDMFADEFSSPTADNQQAQRMSLQVRF